MYAGKDWLWPALVLLNTLNGPGFVVLPAAGRDAGVVGVLALIAVFAFLASFAARRACAVAAAVESGACGPTTSGADIAGPARKVLGAAAGKAVAAACALALVACAVAQIILCVQLADALEGALLGYKCGVAFSQPTGRHQTSRRLQDAWADRGDAAEHYVDIPRATEDRRPLMIERKSELDGVGSSRGGSRRRRGARRGCSVETSRGRRRGLDADIRGRRSVCALERRGQ